MSSICKECHESHSGCCKFLANDEQIQIGLSFSEIYRIMEFSRLSYNDFIDLKDINPDIVQSLCNHLDPVFADLYHENKAFLLKTAQGNCFFLGEQGCSLPRSVRPHYCNIYPFWFIPNTKQLNILINPDCLAQKKVSTIIDLMKLFETSRDELYDIYQCILRDYQDHASEIGDYFSKTIIDNFEFKALMPEHKNEVLEMVKDIWEGDDYIPYVYDQWIADQNGLFVGAFYQNAIAGIAKLSFYEPSYAWLEGLRANPNLPVRGLANAFNKFFLKYNSDNPSLKCMEFITYYANFASIHSAEKHGFRKIATYSYKIKTINQDETFDLSETMHCTTEEASDFISKSTFIQQSRICSGWEAYPITENILNQHFFNNNHYLCIKENEIINALVLYEIDDLRNMIHLCFIEAFDSITIKKMLKHLIHLCINLNIKEIDCAIPENYPLKTIFNEMGFTSFEQENDYMLFRLLSDS